MLQSQCGGLHRHCRSHLGVHCSREDHPKVVFLLGLPAVYGLGENRPVKFVWTHQTGADGQPATDEAGQTLEPIETMGFLTTSETLEMAASRELTEADLGAWQVEVRGVGPFGAVLYQRTFAVVDPEAETPAS